MKIKIRSRKALQKMVEMPFAERTAIISITDYDDNEVVLKNTPEYILRLAFDDVDNDVVFDEVGAHPTSDELSFVENKFHMFTDEHARKVADFYFDCRENIDVLICQCEHGQSRSAAVAAAILEHKSKNGIAVFSDDRYFPNKVVFRRTLAALNENIKNK